MHVDTIIKYAVKRAHFKARQLIGRSGFTEADFQDLRQELLADVLARLPKFDGRRASAKTFVSRLIDNRIATILEHRHASCRDPRREESSLDDWVRDEDGKWARRGETMDEEAVLARAGRLGRAREERDDLAIDTQVVIDGLPDDLKDLCVRLKTQTVARISRDTGVSRPLLYERLKAIRARFREAGVDRYL